jgi:lipoate---protein ligase
MNCLALESHDPFFNQAVDEYLLRNSTEDFLILGINDRSVIVGKHQVAHREADAGFVHRKDIPVIRRISGGGTVFHDRGNLNFSFIRKSEPGRQIDFRKHTLPVLEFLRTIGVKAQFEGKNDLKIDGLKISGNAEHVTGTRVLHHGTLLFDASLADMRSSLNMNMSRYKTRAVESNPSPVVNLREYLGGGISDSEGLMSAMMNYFIDSGPDARLFSLNPGEIGEIDRLAESKYKTWEWNYAYGPEYLFSHDFFIFGEQHSCRLMVKEGIIRECVIEGSELMADAGKKLKGTPHMVADMKRIFYENNIPLDYNDIYNFF